MTVDKLIAEFLHRCKNDAGNWHKHSKLLTGSSYLEDLVELVLDRYEHLNNFNGPTWEELELYMIEEMETRATKLWRVLE